MNTAIILAAGTGSRMKSPIKKQYMKLCGKPLVYYSLKAFNDCTSIDNIIIVTGEEEIDYIRKELVEKYEFNKVSNIVAGGRERYNSVYNGLRYAAESENVLIHDGVRAFVKIDEIQRMVSEVQQYKACVGAVKSKDTVKISDDNEYVVSTPNRKNVWNIQTPQAFRTEYILDAYDKMMKSNDDTITDDAMVMEKYGNGTRIKLIELSYENIKVTTPEDMIIGENLLKMRL